MNSLKLRRLLITVHLCLAGLLAPAFLVVAISGGFYLTGVEAKTETTPIELPAGTTLDLSGETVEEDVRALLAEQGIDVSFEYIRGGGNRAMTRPTTRDFVTFTQGADGLTAELNKPNLQYILMELHKGHGPWAYRMYQVLVALALFFVVVGGLAVGLLAKNYRRSTAIAAGVGLAVTFALAVFA